MKKMRFRKTLIGRCIVMMLLTVTVVNGVPRTSEKRPGTECSVCSDDDIRDNAPGPKPTTPKE